MPVPIPAILAGIRRQNLRACIWRRQTCNVSVQSLKGERSEGERRAYLHARAAADSVSDGDLEFEERRREPERRADPLAQGLLAKGLALWIDRSAVQKPADPRFADAERR